MELLIGCGANREKKIGVVGREQWTKLITLDHNADHKPDVIWNLEKMPLPFKNDTFDEIHAYDVLEHTGRQGDWRFFFDQFAELHRILKPNGYLMGIVPAPASVWAWGDPSHTRVIPPESFTFLTQRNYDQVGKTPMSDFRFYYRADFELLGLDTDNVQTRFLLKAVK